MLRALCVFILCAGALSAQPGQTVWSDREKPIREQLAHLRALPDDTRASVTARLAREIRALPTAPNKLQLALGLAGLATEGDFGRDTLQLVTTTLELALREQPQPSTAEAPAAPYMELAQLARYEHMTVNLEAPQYTAALAALAEDDRNRAEADFTLADLHGKPWRLSELRGRVVLVNFWATWCPPCRKEMPDLEALYARFQDRGLVILAISDEDAGKVSAFLATRKISYPVLLDPGRKVNGLFRVDGIPKSYVYDRDGRLVGQAIDMRTQGQFLAMLAAAGLQ
jgi:peroxiredoxin